MPELTLKMSLKVTFILYIYLYPLRAHHASVSGGDEGVDGGHFHLIEPSIQL